MDNSLPPGMASKVYEMWNFLETGLWGHLGRAGLIHLRRRSYVDLPPYFINAGIAILIRMFSALLKYEYKREFWVRPKSGEQVPRFLAASDAAADDQMPTPVASCFSVFLAPSWRLWLTWMRLCEP